MKKIFTWVGPRLSGERSRRQVVYSPEARQGIERYLFGPVYRQLRDELGRVPDRLSFVFGHTHKPFENALRDPDGREIELYNTGGWPIDSREPFTAMGASVLFINERLDLASLRVYNDGEVDGDVSLDVRHAAPSPEGDEFVAAIQDRIRGSGLAGEPAAPWKELEARIRQAILRRRRHHEEEPE